jgi:hypothetical protein
MPSSYAKDNTHYVDRNFPELKPTQTYLPVTVYSPAFGNCSAGGVTATKPSRLVVPCPNGHIDAQTVVEQEYVVLDLEIKNSGYRCFKQRGDKRWLMMGGQFVYSTDSRFRSAYGDYPIPVHDRYEG